MPSFFSSKKHLLLHTSMCATLLDPVVGMKFAEEPFRPVSKVVELLSKMQTQLQSEKSEDDSMDKKMSCWCHDTTKEKEQAISEGQNTIQGLKASIEEKKGRIGNLATEVEELEHDIGLEMESLEEATKLRQDALATFNENQKDLSQSINALEGAISVLKKHQGIANNAFLQHGGSEQDAFAKNLMEVQKRLQNSEFKTPLGGEKEKALIQKVMQIPTDSKNVYTTQSGEVFGILEEMKASFQSDLQALEDKEKSDVAHFQTLKADKEMELQNMNRMKKEKEAQMGSLGADLNADKENLINEEDALSADQDFLQQMTADCANFDGEYAHRSEERQLELEAIATALSYLHSDEAHDLFSRTYSLSFSQFGMVQNNEAKDIKHSAFEKVKQGIDKMVTDLKSQIVEEKEARDLCIADLDMTDKDIASTDRDKSDLAAKKAHLESRIESLSNEMSHLEELIAQSEQALAKAGAMREQDHTSFSGMVKNQNDSIEVLKKALNVLEQVYASKFSEQSVVFAQSSNVGNNQMSLTQVDPKPSGFGNKYSRNNGGQKVLSLISDIINDSLKSKELAIQSEQEAQSEYEHLVMDSNKSMKQYKRLATEKKESRAQRKKELKSTTKELAHTEASLAELKNKRQGRADGCMFLLNNFEIRQAHMTKESEALLSAKAYLEAMQ